MRSMLKKLAGLMVLLCHCLPLLACGSAAAKQIPAATDDEVKIVQYSTDRHDLPSLAEVLSAPDQAALEASSERCLRTASIRSHQILDDRHVVFRMRNGERYLTRFPSRCIGLRRGSALRMYGQGGRLCHLDSVRALPRDSFAGDPGVPCTITGFVQLSPEQVEYLRAALKQRR